MSIIILQGKEEKAQRIHYEVDSSLPALGEGGMGQVRRGVRVDEKTGLKSDVAIKFLFEDLSEKAIARARREASVRIHNENLVEMFGFVEVADNKSKHGEVKRYHVVSELLEGVMLYDVIKGKTTDRYGKQVAFAQELYQMYCDDRFRFAILITRNVLSGLMALHDQGYIHRDVDPSNIMVTHNRKIKLRDFGIAKKLGEGVDADDMQLTSAGQFVGKAAYAAPELVLGDLKHQNRTTDLYAVGIMLYQFVMGKLPFEGDMMQLIQKQIHEKLPLKDIPYKSLRTVIGKATEKKQGNRYHSAAEMRVALEKLSDQGADVSRTASDIIASKVEGNKKLLYAILGTVAAVALIACAAIFWPRSTEAGSDGSETAALADGQVQDTTGYEVITDASSGAKVIPVTMLIHKAINLLGDSTRASEGVEQLQEITTQYGTYRHAAPAFALLAALTQPVDADVSAKSIKEMRAATANVIQRDAPLAHKYAQQAFDLDSTCYQGVFELATDFCSAATRTGDDSLQDFTKALKLFNSGIKYARQEEDDVYVKLFETRIEQVTSMLQ